MNLDILNNNGEKLSGILEGAPSTQLIIICHGLADSKENPVLEGVTHALGRFNIPNYRFDFSGNGKSEGAFEESTYHKQVDDLKAVLGHFMKEGIKQFILIAHSMGGGVAKIVAAQDPHVKGLMDLAGVSRAESFKDKFPDLVQTIRNGGVGYFMEERLGHRYPIGKAYLDSTESIDIMAFAPHFSCAIICIQGDEDVLLRQQHTQEFLDKCSSPDKAFVMLKGVDHFFNRFKEETLAMEGRKKLIGVITPWIMRHI